ncbi:MAG: hypothetical protein WCU00_03905 [Candidatus Latescibacterota bacterium]
MKAMAEHHWSGDTMLFISIGIGIIVGAMGGWIVGAATNNLGMGITIGTTAGLVIGLAAGIFLSDREEK